METANFKLKLDRLSIVTMSYDSTLPSCCVECAQAYTMAHHQQTLETYLISQHLNDSLGGELELKRNNNVDRIAPISIKGQGAGSSKSVSSPRDVKRIPETKPLNVSRNKHNDPSINSVPSRSPRNRIKSGEREPENGFEYKPFTSSVPAQDRSPSNRAHDHQQSQNPRETGLSNSASKPRKHNDALPPIPTQDTKSSNGGPQFQYPQETRVPHYSVDKPQAHVAPLSIPSVRTDERNQPNYAQIPPQDQQPRETRVSFIANKPRDSDHVEPLSVPIQEKSRSNFSQPHSQSQETQANKSREHAERPKASIQIQDQNQGHSATDASKTDTRPHLMHGTPSQMDTQYVNMLLALDDIPMLHNILAKFFNWILLAGFILFPGTFTSLKNLGGSGQVEQQLVHVVTSIPL
jgi:hypothetical protein